MDSKFFTTTGDDVYVLLVRRESSWSIWKGSGHLSSRGSCGVWANHVAKNRIKLSLFDSQYYVFTATCERRTNNEIARCCCFSQLKNLKRISDHTVDILKTYMVFLVHMWDVWCSRRVSSSLSTILGFLLDHDCTRTRDRSQKSSQQLYPLFGVLQVKNVTLIAFDLLSSVHRLNLLKSCFSNDTIWL